MTMRRGDRKDFNYDNAINNPCSRQKEPAFYHELNFSLMTVRANLEEVQKLAKHNEEAASQRYEAEQRAKEAALQLIHVQQKIQTYQIEANELKERVNQNYLFCSDEQRNHKKTLYLYNEEKADRIQSLVDSVDEETTNNPMGLVQKFKRIWLVIKDILSK
ncbi:hypothetical protein ANSO36C_59680 [Nostoc cf. commune SO-36]|uniref:Uncharacterized protein n=1 Tax=Nostoc cf. commune SO-36 TaxID=449208 RepID=A0ABN6QAG8_NOSCO|nr:hypothetical protein [Nostoc commune]BDI20166.1 hypothetical protein ANSO36C_59680 [Nostoc cf. commune SO-36]